MHHVAAITEPFILGRVRVRPGLTGQGVRPDGGGGQSDA
jgi:hypothetical protein